MRNLTIPMSDALYASLTRFAGRQTAATGKRVSMAEVARQAIESAIGDVENEATEASADKVEEPVKPAVPLVGARFD